MIRFTMDSGHPTQIAARAAAEEILRIIYGDDLTGCTVSLDRITAVIATAMTGQAQVDRAIAELNEKAYEAIRLLSTPPADGASLDADGLRSLLSDRLDKIQALANKVIATTQSQKEIIDEPTDPTSA
jgi:NurA-like 5'-3' nuclease